MSMRTLYLQADAEAVSRAAEVIRAGGLVAFPTETVYGLGADALSAPAVTRIFEAKERPRGNPLIVHLADVSALEEVVARVPARVEDIARRFWPGPLTLVLPRAPAVPLVTTGGLETVAVRVPAHPVARALIHAASRPIAAPSANRSGGPSPTRAEHVREDLDGRIEIILDGGPAPLGVESTVLDMTSEPPTLLRPGGVTLEQLESCLGEVRRLSSDADEAAGRSPGLRFRHYAPRAQIVLIEAGTGERAVLSWLEDGRTVALMVQRAVALEKPGLTVKIMPADPEGYARQLFGTLRELDSRGMDAIFVEAIAEEGLGRTVMDRLRRAAS
ncbi:MAG TPA: L-threonylcarbamoyladenylate synthase [Candidatus Eisenbacteria bacterium]|nr:L-threonylcarbamoyladenylate synthase [Candidatus Eisenbacteria bacterium]